METEIGPMQLVDKHPTVHPVPTAQISNEYENETAEACENHPMETFKSNLISLPKIIDLNGALIHSVLPPNHVKFCEVVCRLSLTGYRRKYNVSVGEICRRILGPESFNTTLITSMLRRAKSTKDKDCLETNLFNMGLSISNGRRSKTITIFSALVENEAAQLALEFSQFTKEYFPTKDLCKVASNVLETSCNDNNTDGEPETLSQQLMATRDVFNNFNELLNTAVLSMDENSNFLEVDQSDPLLQFSAFTHGFGLPALQVGLNVFNDLINGMLADC